MSHYHEELNTKIESLINNALPCIKEGNLEQATSYLDEALNIMPHHNRVLTGLKYIKFWQPRLEKLSSMDNLREEGITTKNHWKNFKHFTTTLKENDNQQIQCIRHYIFSRILTRYSHSSNKNLHQYLDLWHGIALKCMGDYEKAKKCFIKAKEHNTPQALVFSEMADTYALMGDDLSAKLMFREAFYEDAQRIDIDGFEAELFNQLIKQIKKQKQYSLEELKEWIPVYGIVWQILNNKRTISKAEHSTLLQRIFDYEQSYKDNIQQHIYIPRLLNHYFRLIDYYVEHKEVQSKIDEILTKIKTMAPEIHKEYTGHLPLHSS